MEILTGQKIGNFFIKKFCKYLKKNRRKYFLIGGERMKNTIKFILFFVIIFAILLIAPNIVNAATPATDEESLLSAISSSDSVALQNDITVTKPIVIQKEITIDGNGHNVVGSPDWTSTSGNQTMFTAQLSDGKLTLKNIKLKNGPKYGVQSYDGATVILDNVSVTGFNYGGVLVNGGKVEVINLHLGYNGTGANNGIEIDKGAYATNNPTLTMNGTLITDTNENVVRVAENGHLTEFTITNTSNTTNKIVVSGKTVALTDANNNVISESTIPESATVNADIKQAIVTVIAIEQTNKIAVDIGTKITSDMLKSHMNLDESIVIDGFYQDVQYTTEFNFNNPINADTTIYVKTSAKQVPPETDNVVEEKDETPKTGVQNYLGLSIFVIVFSAITMITLRRKEMKG